MTCRIYPICYQLPRCRLLHNGNNNRDIQKPQNQKQFPRASAGLQLSPLNAFVGCSVCSFRGPDVTISIMEMVEEGRKELRGVREQTSGSLSCLVEVLMIVEVPMNLPLLLLLLLLLTRNAADRAETTARPRIPDGRRSIDMSSRDMAKMKLSNVLFQVRSGI